MLESWGEMPRSRVRVRISRKRSGRSRGSPPLKTRMRTPHRGQVVEEPQAPRRCLRSVGEPASRHGGRIAVGARHVAMGADVPDDRPVRLLQRVAEALQGRAARNTAPLSLSAARHLQQIGHGKHRWIDSRRRRIAQPRILRAASAAAPPLDRRSGHWNRVQDAFGGKHDVPARNRGQLSYISTVSAIGRQRQSAVRWESACRRAQARSRSARSTVSSCAACHGEQALRRLLRRR